MRIDGRNEWVDGQGGRETVARRHVGHRTTTGSARLRLVEAPVRGGRRKTLRQRKQERDRRLDRVYLAAITAAAVALLLTA